MFGRRLVGFSGVYNPTLSDYRKSTYNDHYRGSAGKRIYTLKPGYSQSTYWSKPEVSSHTTYNYSCPNAYKGVKLPDTAHLHATKNIVSQPKINSSYTVRKTEVDDYGANTGNYAYTNEVYTTTSTSHDRARDKEELQRLNERFAQYIMKVRQLGQQSSQLDSIAFLQSTKILEEEVTNLKNLYEKELYNIRLQLEESIKERNHFQQLCGKYQQTIQDLEARLSAETDKNRKLHDQINGLQQRISSLEQELIRMRNAPRSMEDIPQMKRSIESLTRDNDSWKQRFEKELLLRKEIEEKMIALQKKVEFDQRVQNEQQSELRQRLETSNSTIVSLEARVRELSKTDTNVPELLRQVREAAEIELKKYQAQSEEQYNKNIYALKGQMNSDATAIERLEKEKAQILASVGDWKAQISSLEGQIKQIEHERSSLADLIQQERSRSAAQIQSMEKRFRELYEMVFVRMKEASISREAYIPLKAEIEALKVLLEEEERRLSVPVDFSVTRTQKMTSQTFSSSPTVTRSYVASYGPQQAWADNTTRGSYHTSLNVGNVWNRSPPKGTQCWYGRR